MATARKVVRNEAPTPTTPLPRDAILNKRFSTFLGIRTISVGAPVPLNPFGSGVSTTLAHGNATLTSTSSSSSSTATELTTTVNDALPPVLSTFTPSTSTTPSSTGVPSAGSSKYCVKGSLLGGMGSLMLLTLFV
ncbi:hypothetical protein CPC08DRAFT_717700 [Agrocybe pediades]|nr:hypothetical protein CPC08DRAFT_717700 [Agrocybe pediades]